MNALTMALFLSSLTSGMDMEEVRSNLISTVRYLSEEVGERSYLQPGKLEKAALYIEERFRSYGLSVERQALTYRGKSYYNIIAEVKGREGSDGIIVIGAHYDTVAGTPGADDNASGVATLLELARLTVRMPLERTVRFVAFGLEEPPVFMTSRMGSYIYAKGLKEEGVNLYGMISLEMTGYFCDNPGCQHYPLPGFRWFYPERGDFIAFVGNIPSRRFTNRLRDSFRASSTLPVESLNTLSIVPGVNFSDHWSFWRFGFPAIMVTDTAFYRNPNYHGPGDTPSTLDYDRMARLVTGLHRALGEI